MQAVLDNYKSFYDQILPENWIVFLDPKFESKECRAGKGFMSSKNNQFRIKEHQLVGQEPGNK